MPVKVVDASALAALLFGEPEGGRIAERFEGARLIAPDLLGLELANACLKKIRRQPDRREALLAAFDLFERMEIERIGVDPAQSLRLADVTGLTAYDAAYLWLANETGAELVTLDGRLSAAAVRR